MHWSQLARHYTILLLVAGGAIFFNLGTPRLWDRDEPRNAGCAAEMLARGDWIVPVFNGQLRSAKPVLLNWLIMGSYGLFGVNEWGARLPSAVLSLGTVLVTYHLGRRLFNPTAALWSAIVLATSLLFDMSARAATPDAALIFFTTLGLMLFARGWFSTRDESSESLPCSGIRQNSAVLSWRLAVPQYAALALAVLTKGPVGIVLPAAIMGLFVMFTRLPSKSDDVSTNATWLERVKKFLQGVWRVFAPTNIWSAGWQLQPLLCAAVVVAIALPWYVCVGLRTDGVWLEAFLWHDNVRRVLEPLESHRGSVLFYPATILLGMFPWSVFVVPVGLETAARLIRRDSRAAGYLFCLLWICVYVGLFTLARTKLPSYITPCLPALALLAGAFVERWQGGSLVVATWWPRVALGALGLAGVLLLVVLSYLAQRYFPGDEWLGTVALIPLLGAGATLMFTWQNRPRRAAIAFALMAAALPTAFFGWVMVRVDRHQQAQVFFETIRERSSQPRLASFGCLESSWVFYAGQPIVEFQVDGLPKTSPFARLPAATTSADQHVAQFIAQEEAFVITSAEYLPYLRPHLRDDMTVIAEIPYFLQGERLLLLGRAEASATGVTSVASFSAGL